MKARGYGFYDIGLQQFSAQLYDFPDEKQINVSHYKRGFGGSAYAWHMAEKYYGFYVREGCIYDIAIGESDDLLGAWLKMSDDLLHLLGGTFKIAMVVNEMVLGTKVMEHIRTFNNKVFIDVSSFALLSFSFRFNKTTVFSFHFSTH